MGKLISLHKKRDAEMQQEFSASQFTPEEILKHALTEIRENPASELVVCYIDAKTGVPCVLQSTERSSTSLGLLDAAKSIILEGWIK